ncbi:MAG: DUF4465 domain-containing protein [Muribaculaceae bacterium]|nr:DUF4465 domain-containing protein [Muribaculaceae bacterium]
MKIRRNLIIAAAMLASVNAMADAGYSLRTLTFEDAEGSQKWEALIDSPQYGGKLLYGPEAMGFDNYAAAYKWVDTDNTFLSSALCEGWGSWCYWTGGHAVSDYGTSAFNVYNSYQDQLTVYDPDADKSLSRSGHGHNGSKNFAVHYGYTDDSGYAALTQETLPALVFSDGKARVIDHMWVNNTCYALSCYMDGNDLTASIGEDDWVKIVATGYNEGITGTVEMYLCNGPDDIVMDWTLFDLSSLGEVQYVKFNVAGSSDNGYGFSQPAYFAFDDVAVRFPDSSSDVDQIECAGVNEADDAYYDLTGRRVEHPSKGIYIHRGKKIVLR